MKYKILLAPGIVPARKYDYVDCPGVILVGRTNSNGDLTIYSCSMYTELEVANYASGTWVKAISLTDAEI